VSTLLGLLHQLHSDAARVAKQEARRLKGVARGTAYWPSSEGIPDSGLPEYAITDGASALPEEI